MAQVLASKDDKNREPCECFYEDINLLLSFMIIACRFFFQGLFCFIGLHEPFSQAVAHM